MYCDVTYDANISAGMLCVVGLADLLVELILFVWLFWNVADVDKINVDVASTDG